MNTYEFGRFLSQLRKEKGMTQVQLAEKLNVTDKAISRWETGKNYPDIEIFEDLSKILDVSISELLEGKKIEKEKLFDVSEEHIVKQIKKNKKNNKTYLSLISILLIFTIIISYFAVKNSGILDGVIYHKFPCYSNDISTMVNTLNGYITTRPKAKGDFIINDGYFFINQDKTADTNFYLSGACENGRSFYINTTPTRNGNFFVGEYRKNQEPLDGITFKELNDIVLQLDFSLLTKCEKYELQLTGIETLNDSDLNLNDHQKSIKKFLYSKGTLSKYSKNTISGKYFIISIVGYNDLEGTTVGNIFCKK